MLLIFPLTGWVFCPGHRSAPHPAVLSVCNSCPAWGVSLISLIECPSTMLVLVLDFCPATGLVVGQR